MEVDQDNLRMQFSALNVNFSSLNFGASNMGKPSKCAISVIHYSGVKRLKTNINFLP